MALDKIVKFFVDIYKAYKASETAQAIYTAFTILTIAVGVKGFLQARQMMSKGQDILANKTAAGGKIPVIYGNRRVGAQIVYMDTAQNRSRDLFVVYALAVGECDEIIPNSIEIDGNSIYDGNIYKGGGYVGSDRYGQTGYNNHRPLNTASQVGDNQYSSAGNLGTNPALRYSFVFNLHHGASSQTVDPMLSASIGSQWTTAHKLNGICYIAASFDYDKKGMYKGVPQITVQVKGKKVFDPRDSSTGWSSNPALCFLDYIQNDEYGKGLATSQINMTTIGAAADKCDILVDQPYYNGSYQNATWTGNTGDDYIVINDYDDWFQNKIDEIVDIRDSNGDLVIDEVDIKDSTSYEFYDQTQENRVYINDILSEDYTNEAGTIRGRTKRFHCNGYIDTNKNVMDNAKELLANMRGIFLYVDGKYELQIEDTGTSTFSINDDHIIANAGISVDYGNKDKRANKVVIEFFNANKKYELDTATVLHDASPEYYSDDGEVLEIKAEFPYVTDPYIAYNMGKAILTRSRNQTTMQFLGTPEMYKLNVGDIVDLTYFPLNFNVKICRVEALELQANGLVAVSLIEYFDVYTWEVPAQEPRTVIAHPPSIGALHPPEANSIVFTDTDASSINRPTLTWTEPTDFPVKEFRVDVENTANPPVQVFSKLVNTNSVDLSFLAKGSYKANITSINGVGIESNAIVKTFTIADDPVKTAEVEIGSETLSNIIDYGTIAGGGTQNFFQINTRLDLEDRFIWNSNGTNHWSLGTGGDDDVNLYIEGSADKLITFKDQSSELGSVKLTFGDDVSGSYFADFITLEADWTNGHVTTGSGLSKFYIKGKGYDGSTASGTIATFQLTSADGYGIPLTELHGKTKTPILNLDQGSAPSTTTDLLYNVGGSLYWNGAVVDTGAGDITGVTINTSGGSLTGGASFSSGDATFTLDIGTTVRGSKSFEDDATFESNVVIEGNLDVQGTTTTIDTANLDVKDKNITLNYGTGDTSANANGAGITIQDAVSATQDATLTWNTSNDSFNFSHPLNVTGAISTTGSITSTNGTVDLYDNSGNKPKIKFREDGSDAFILEYNGDGSGIGNYVAFYSNVTGWVSKGSGLNYIPANGRVGIGLTNPSEKLSVVGNITVTGTVDGRDIATDGTKLDGIEAGATTDQTQAEINALGITAIGLSGTPNITVGTINSGAITSSGNIKTTNGLFQASLSNTKLRQYDISTSQGGGNFLLGKIEHSDDADGGVTGVVKAAYDYGSTIDNVNIHFAFAQRNGVARGHWWYENTDDDSGGDNISVKLIDDGSGGMFVWLIVGDYAKCFVEAYWRQCESVTETGTLSSGTVTTGTTLFDTANDPTSEHHIGKLNAHNDISVTGDATISGELLLGNSNTKLSKADTNSNRLKIQTPSGYTEIGAGNTAYSHFDTDRAKFYFNKRIIVDEGIISSYNEDLVLQRAQSTVATFTTTGAIFAGAIISTNSGNRLDALSIGDDSDIYLYEGSTNVLNIRTGASGSYKYFTFQDDGYFNTNSGGISTGGTVRITSTGNLTNIGTITAGTITSGDSSTSGNVRSYHSDGSYVDLKGYGLEFSRVTSYIRPTTDGTKTLNIGGTDASLDWSSIKFRSVNGLYMTGTQFLTTDRNLVNIGSISANGNIVTTNTSAVIQTPRISMEADGTLDWGSSRQYGTLTWDTNKAIIKGQINTSLEFRTNNSGVALTLNTSQNANFANDVTVTNDLNVGQQITASGGITTDQSGQTISGFSTIRVGDALIGQDVATLTTTSASVTNRILASATTYRTLKVLVQIKSGTNFHATEILLTHNGTTVYMTEYATIFSNTSLATFDADISGGNIRLLVDPNQATSTEFKFSVSGIET